MTQLRDLNDEELVWRAQQGVEDAFTALYERYVKMVFRRVCYTIPQPDVEDVTQDVFISMLRSLKNFRGDSQFKTWMRTVMNRTIADYYRRRDPVDFPQDTPWDNGDEHLPEFLKSTRDDSLHEDVILVRQALGRMPAKYQEILLLRFSDDLPFSAIAQLQGQSLEATKSLFRRAIAMLQKILEESYA